MHYSWLRFTSYFLFPFLRFRSPLRGYYNKTEELISQGHENYIAIDVDSMCCSILSIETRSMQGSSEKFVAVIPKGRVLHDYGVIISPNHKLIGDVSFNLGGSTKNHAVMFQSYFPKVQYFQGRVAVLSSTAHQRYFHWMFDVLPRFKLLQQSQILVDAYIINSEKSFQRESIELLGLSSKLVISPQFDTHLEADWLVVPSLPGKVGSATRWSCDFLRSIFLDKSCQTRPGRAFYITRNDALTRRVLNETDVLTELSEYGFEILELERVSVVEQAKLFSEAKVIIAPHGAGLTNIVFCQQDSLIIEFMASTYKFLCFQQLASLLSLSYICLEGRVPAVSKGYTDQTHDHYVDTAQLRLILQQFLN